MTEEGPEAKYTRSFGERVLVVQTGFIGDVILSTPVLPNLRRLFSTSEITFLTTPAAADLVRFHPDIDNLMLFDKRGTDSGFRGLFRMAQRLKSAKFDLAVTLHKSWRTAVLLKLAGIPVRLGFAESSARWLYTGVAKRRDLPHEVLRNLAILRIFEIEPTDAVQRMCVALPPEANARAEELLSGHRGKTFVGVAPGSAWETKRWPVEYFAQLCDALAADGCAIVILGSEQARPAVDRLSRLARAPLIDLVGRTTLLESAAVIAKLRLLITNDSAPLHLASASGVPIVALFCATVPQFGFGPWQVDSECLGVEDLYCRPCGRHGGNICPTGTHACQLGLKPPAAIAAARRLLERGRVSTP